MEYFLPAPPRWHPSVLCVRLSTTPSTYRSVGTNAPISMPSLLAREERTDSGLSFSPSISLDLMTSCVNTRSVASSTSLKPRACMLPSKRPRSSVTLESNSDRRTESNCHEGHSGRCQMYLLYSPHCQTIGAVFAVIENVAPGQFEMRSWFDLESVNGFLSYRFESHL